MQTHKSVMLKRNCDRCHELPDTLLSLGFHGCKVYFSVVPVPKLITQLQNLSPETGYTEWGFVFFLSHSRQMLGYCFMLCQNIFSNSLFTNLLPPLFLQLGSGLDHPNNALFQL